MKTIKFNTFVVGSIKSEVEISDELYERVQNSNDEQVDEAMDEIYDILNSYVANLGDWTDHEIDLTEFWDEIES